MVEKGIHFSAARFVRADIYRVLERYKMNVEIHVLWTSPRFQHIAQASIELYLKRV